MKPFPCQVTILESPEQLHQQVCRSSGLKEPLRPKQQPTRHRLFQAGAVNSAPPFHLSNSTLTPVGVSQQINALCTAGARPQNMLAAPVSGASEQALSSVQTSSARGLRPPAGCIDRRVTWRCIDLLPSTKDCITAKAPAQSHWTCDRFLGILRGAMLASNSYISCSRRHLRSRPASSHAARLKTSA
jgi:hypothetical protein